jgi:hypothetical protein
VLRVPAESVLEGDGLLHGEVGPVPLEPRVRRLRDHLCECRVSVSDSE